MNSLGLINALHFTAEKESHHQPTKIIKKQSIIWYITSRTQYSRSGVWVSPIQISCADQAASLAFSFLYSHPDIWLPQGKLKVKTPWMLPLRQLSPEGQVSGVCSQADSGLHTGLVSRRISWDSCGRPGCAPHDPAGLSRSLTPTQSTFLLYSKPQPCWSCLHTMLLPSIRTPTHTFFSPINLLLPVSYPTLTILVYLKQL